MKGSIVILRTVSVEKMSPVLDVCRERWPSAPLWVVSSPSRFDEMKRDVRVDRAISYRGQSGFSCPVTLETGLSVAAVVVPTANENGSGYGNVLGAALGVEASEYYLCSRCRKLRSLGRTGFVLRARAERTLGFLASTVSGYWAERTLEAE